MTQEQQNTNPNSTAAASDGGRGGIQFGTGIAYDDAYGHAQEEYVDSLPTKVDLPGEEEEDGMILLHLRILLHPPQMMQPL